MRTYNFTNGKKEVKIYKEVSVKNQGCYKEGEMIQKFATDNISKHQNEMYQTVYVEVK